MLLRLRTFPSAKATPRGAPHALLCYRFYSLSASFFMCARVVLSISKSLHSRYASECQGQWLKYGSDIWFGRGRDSSSLHSNTSFREKHFALGSSQRATREGKTTPVAHPYPAVSICLALAQHLPHPAAAHSAMRAWCRQETSTSTVRWRSVPKKNAVLHGMSRILGLRRLQAGRC